MGKERKGAAEKPERREGFNAGPLLKELREWVLWIGLAIILSYVIGNALNFVLGSSTPLVAVMSGSMVHDSTSEQAHYAYLMSAGFTRQQIDSFPLKGGFNKGDVLVVKGEKVEGLKVGDIIVFNKPGAAYPIIHRIIGIEKDTLGNSYYRTKGDHNPAEDMWLTPYSSVQGKAVFRMPFIGYVKVIPMEICTGLGLCKTLF